MTELEYIIGYEFKNKELLETALTHSSYANEQGKGVICNERLEFLGDSVLSLVVSTFIYNNFPEYPEGNLTKLRASLVCEKALFAFAKEIRLGDFIKLSHGEKRGGGANRPSIVSDAFEAVIAALYLDGGYEIAQSFVLKFVEPQTKHIKAIPVKDYKTTLQEIVQKNPGERIEYRLVGESGPDHNKHFTVEVMLNSNCIGKGGGRSKKEAEQQAAREALELMGY